MGHKDEKQERTGIPPQQFDLLKDPKRIHQHLLKSHLEADLVEVSINDRSRNFFSYFMDHLPELGLAGLIQESLAASGMQADASVTSETPSYEALSYLRDHDRLIIAPLIPVLGNAQIRSSKDVLLRFFQEIKCIEAEVLFERTLMIRGEPALQLSYPRELRIYRRRRHFRAKVTKETEISCTVEKEEATRTVTLETRAIDISVGGLSFCNPWPAESLPVGEPVRLTLRAKGVEEVKVAAFVRNHGRATLKEGCSKGDGRCGVQFDVTTESIATLIEELVAYVQREFLQEVQVRKKHEGKKGDRSEEEPTKESGLMSDLEKFLGLKKLPNLKG